MKCFPKNEPWITRDLKQFLNKKIQAYKGVMELILNIQKLLKIKQGAIDEKAGKKLH